MKNRFPKRRLRVGALKDIDYEGKESTTYKTITTIDFREEEYSLR